MSTTDSPSLVRRLADPWLWVPSKPEDPLCVRDARFIREEIPRIAPFFDHYHDVTVEGLERVPDRPVLLVGNHNGGTMAPDMFALMLAWWRTRGTEDPAYGLMHDFVFRMPPLGRYMARLGAVPAHPGHAATLLGRGSSVLVYPGGDIDAYRPASKRGEIVFGERAGFVRLALRAGVPIVPVVSAGAHDAVHIFTDGREIVRRLGLKRLMRVEVLPIAAGLPWGLFAGPLPYWPLPVRMKVVVLEPMSWPALGAEAANDRDLVAQLRDEVRDRMQCALDELTAEGGWGRRLPF